MSAAGRRDALIDLGRAFGGALFFTLPLLMTMEMWYIGIYMSRWRLALFLVVFVPVLVRLTFQAGFREAFSWRDGLLDGFTAYAVGFATAGFFLWLFGLLPTGASFRDVAGKVSLQAVPASIGAALARSQLGGGKARNRQRREGAKYGSELFLMAVGSLFFAFNVAPTEEMELISYKMAAWQLPLLALASVLTMHAFIYALQFRGQEQPPKGVPWWSTFLRFTLAGYALALGISLYSLWTFGRLDGNGLSETAARTVVLGLPAALGAAAARLIL